MALQENGHVIVPPNLALAPNRKWCLLCPLSFPTAEGMMVHYEEDHPMPNIRCTTCENCFKDHMEYNFHVARGHHRNIPFPVVTRVYGNRLFNNVTNEEFHLLVRNGLDAPPEAAWPDVPPALGNYRTIQLARIKYEEDRKAVERQRLQEVENIRREEAEKIRREEAEKKTVFWFLSKITKVGCFANEEDAQEG